MKTAILIAGLAAGTALGGVTGAAASTFSADYTSFWALGDSLTDDGNAFAFSPSSIPSPPYFMGRVSNGRTYAELLADDFEAEGKATGNLAFAGARAVPDANAIPDLPAQAFGTADAGLVYPDGGSGLASRAAAFGDRPLVSIFAGSNDVLDAFRDGDDPIAAAEGAASQIAQLVGALAGQIQDFLIFNLPDFAEIPRFDGAPDVVAQGATEAAEAFQTELDLALAAFAPGATVIQVDVFSAIRDVVSAPGDYGIENPFDPCLVFGEDAAGDDVLLSACADPSSFAFYDEIHPTDTVHGALADAARAAVAAPVPLPGSAWALLAGLAALGAAAGRRRAA
jgi:phospholipase/lecithinase/hemolysin